MTHYLGDISLFGRGRDRRAVLEKAGNAIAPPQRKPRNSENQWRNRYSPSAGGLLNGYARSAGAGLQWAFGVCPFVGGCLVEAVRHGPVERSETPNIANATTPDTAPRSDASRMGGAGGNHASNTTLVNRTIGIRSTPGAAAGRRQASDCRREEEGRRFGGGDVLDRVGIHTVILATSIHISQTKGAENR